MAIHTEFISHQQHILHPFFSLDINQHPTHVDMTMETKTSLVTTGEIPNILLLAKKHIPQIFQNECFNYHNVPFSEELKNTEVAHLFEHILITILYAMQEKRGNTDAVYDGLTSWNWEKEKVGKFHIKITLEEDDTNRFAKALKKSIRILERIYLAHEMIQKRQTIH